MIPTSDFVGERAFLRFWPYFMVAFVERRLGSLRAVLAKRGYRLA